MDRRYVLESQGKPVLACVERRVFTGNTMKGEVSRNWWLLVILLQVLFMLDNSNAKQCMETSFQVLGVFDGSDTGSIHVFRNSLGDINKLLDEGHGCPPRVKQREILLHDNMSAINVINAAANVFSGGEICYMIYSSYGSNGRFVLDYALTNGIPVVSTIPKKRYDSRGYEHYSYDAAKVINLNERSTRSTKVQVILDFLLKEKHKEFVTITNTDFDDIRVVTSLRQVIKQHNMVMVDWFVIPTGDPYDYVIPFAESKLQTLKSEISSFLIITNDMLWAEMIFAATREAQEKGVGTTEYNWIIVSDMDLEIIRATFFPHPLFTIYPRIRHELSNSDYVEDAIGVLKYSLKELTIFSSARCPSVKEIQRYLPKITFPGKTSCAVTFNEERERQHDIYDISIIYVQDPPNVQDPPPNEVQTVGNWSSGKIIITELEDPPPILKVVIIEYAPNIMSQPKISPNEPCTGASLPCFHVIKAGKEEKKQERCCYGFVIDALKLVAQQLKVTPYLVFNDNGIYGAQGENGSWNGIVHDLMTGKADMSPDLFPTSRRADVIDFTEPYMPSGIALLVKESKRKQNEIYWTSYMRPFTGTLWYFVVGAVGVLIAFLWIADKVSPSFSNKRIFHWHASFRIDNAVCYVLQLTFGRPADEKKPRTNGARLTSVIFGLAMMIIIASYSANLAAFLIVNEMTTPVTNIHDEKIRNPPPDFYYGTLEGSYMDNFFKTSSKEYFKKIWFTMKKKNVKSLAEGVAKVRSGELDVFIADSVGLQYEALNDPYCELKVVGEPFAMSGASFAVKKGSPFLTSLSTALGSLKSEGLTDFIQKFWVKKFTCNKDTPPVQLHFKDLSGLFLQLLIAMLLCVVLTFSHFGWRYLDRTRKNCKSKKKVQKEEDLEFQMDNYRPEFEPLKETNL